MKKYLIPIFIFVIIVFIFLGFKLTKNPPINSLSTINVVSAENFWGSLAIQIGGSKVNVLSVVNDPNADPHEYESSTKDGLAIANANIVIINGAGYDSWASKLLSTSPIHSNRQVIDVASLEGKKNGDNPHFWYDQSSVSDVVNSIANSYINIDPKDSQYFSANKNTLISNLQPLQKVISDIKTKHQGTIVASTEDIFVGLAKETGLNLISPASFMQAVAEGNDPPSSSVAEFEEQLNSGKVRLLVYNEQTITPLTNQMKQLAIKNKIPVVGISETTTPSNITYQDWMYLQVSKIERALDANK